MQHIIMAVLQMSYFSLCLNDMNIVQFFPDPPISPNLQRFMGEGEGCDPQLLTMFLSCAHSQQRVYSTHLRYFIFLTNTDNDTATAESQFCTFTTA